MKNNLENKVVVKNSSNNFTFTGNEKSAKSSFVDTQIDMMAKRPDVRLIANEIESDGIVFWTVYDPFTNSFPDYTSNRFYKMFIYNDLEARIGGLKKVGDYSVDKVMRMYNKVLYWRKVKSSLYPIQKMIILNKILS